MPTAWERPTTEDALVDVVRRAAETGATVKAVGAGHSYSAIACTGGHLVDLSGDDAVLAADPASGLVTVEAGITLRRLNDELHARGLALPVLGDIDDRSIAGATATGTHGPGIRHRTISDAIVGMRVVTGSGAVVDAADAADPEAREPARSGSSGSIARRTCSSRPASCGWSRWSTASPGRRSPRPSPASAG